MSNDIPGGRSISFSQTSSACGLALKYRREHAPEAYRSIDLAYGSALHRGVEVWLEDNTQPIQVAVDAAVAHLRDEEIGKAGTTSLNRWGRAQYNPPIRWDGPPRMTKGSATEAPRPYKGDEGNLQDVEAAEAMLGRHLRSWCWKHGRRLKVMGLELKIRTGFTRPEGWTLSGVLDILHSGGIIDVKTAGKPWEPERIAAKKGQAYLYLASVRRALREMGVDWQPEHFEFHVLIKGYDEPQVVKVDFDAEVVNAYIEYVIRPRIAAIEAGVFIPNIDSPFPHSEKYCGYWNVCPLGAASERNKP